MVYLEEECCVGGPHLHPVGLHEEVPQAQDSRANKQVNKRYKECPTDKHTDGQCIKRARLATSNEMINLLKSCFMVISFYIMRI